MSRRGGKDEDDLKAGGDEPPAGALPLRFLIWVSDCLCNEIFETVRDIFSVSHPEESGYPTGAVMVREDQRIEATTDGSDHPFFWVKDNIFVIDGIRRSKDMARIDLETLGEITEPYEEPTFESGSIWASQSGYAEALRTCALRVFRGELQRKNLVLVGRWGSRRAAFEPVPLDAWPMDEEAAISAGVLDVEAGRLELDSGETVYSLHVVPALGAVVPIALAGKKKEKSTKQRGRREHGDKEALLQYGGELMVKNGGFSADNRGFRRQADLERSLLERASSMGASIADRTARSYAQEIIRRFQSLAEGKK